MKFLTILDGLLNQLLPLIRELLKRFKTVPIEQDQKIEEKIVDEKAKAQKTGRPEW
jgi:hypothetical protein